MRFKEVETKLNVKDVNSIEEKSIYWTAWELMKNYNQQVEDTYSIDDIDEMFWSQGYFNVEKIVIADDCREIYVDSLVFNENDNCIYALGYDMETYEETNGGEYDEELIQTFLLQN